LLYIYYVNDLTITQAEYLKDYTLIVTFSNGVSKKVNFSPFIKRAAATYLSKYKEIKHFKKFKIEEGNLVWGKDWDLIFPVKQLFDNNIML
jgi:hypothetical protein